MALQKGLENKTEDLMWYGTLQEPMMMMIVLVIFLKKIAFEWTKNLDQNNPLVGIIISILPNCAYTFYTNEFIRSVQANFLVKDNELFNEIPK